MTVVLDSSAILALAFGELGAASVETRRQGAMVSTVTLSECLSKLLDHGLKQAEATAALRALGLVSVAFTGGQVWRAGALRSRYRRSGLSFADCACLALAAETGVTALTGDRLWATLDHGVPVELFR